MDSLCHMPVCSQPLNCIFKLIVARFTLPWQQMSENSAGTGFSPRTNVNVCSILGSFGMSKAIAWVINITMIYSQKSQRVAIGVGCKNLQDVLVSPLEPLNVAWYHPLNLLHIFNWCWRIRHMQPHHLELHIKGSELCSEVHGCLWSTKA